MSTKFHLVSCSIIGRQVSGLSANRSVRRRSIVFLARRLLLDKIDTQLRGAASAETQRIEKIRRQKRKRSRRAKTRMLEDKRHHSEKKGRRSTVRPGQDE